jgi:hypothetical protein
MVQAILDGRKTQTRRIVKPPYQGYPSVTKHLTSCEFDFHYVQGVGQFTACPFGKPGDILWVRETWTKTMVRDEDGWFYVYRADGDEWAAPWKPSIFMPKEACRIRLLVKDIRVERLQNISEADAIKEGAPESLSIKDLEALKGMNWEIPSPFLHHQFGFLAIWCKIYGQESWMQNPWVWVVEFEKLTSK